MSMRPFEKCPICGGEMETREVEMLLRGGADVAVMKVEAEVCRHCGERLYSETMVQSFEDIRGRLARQELEGFQPMGRSYRVAL